MPPVSRRGARIEVTCPRGHRLHTTVRAGWTTCGRCRARVYVPAGAAGRTERTWRGAEAVRCGGCGHEFRSRARPGGRTRCPACAARVPVPADPARWYPDIERS